MSATGTMDSPRRIEAELKVTGTARYPGDIRADNAAHAALVPAPIAAGRVTELRTHEARSLPGVIALFSIGDLPAQTPTGFVPWLEDEAVYFAGQPVALVLAETRGIAQQAARLVDVRCEQRTALTDIRAGLDQAYPPDNPRFDNDSCRGDPERGFSHADALVALEYTTPTNNHHPIEPCAIVAWWHGDSLTVHTTTQAVFGTQRVLARSLGVPRDKVRVITRHIGGGFGVKGSLWFPSNVLIALAAHAVNRPVRLELTRGEMFTLVGRRQESIQGVKIGATRDGRLTAIRHDTVAQTAAFADYTDPNGAVSRWLYACPNVVTSHRLVRTNAPQATPMRGPGEGTGSFALESALDELAAELGVDPLELRLRNYADHDQHQGLPWSSNGLRECYRVASQSFGWQRRNPRPRQMHDGRLLVGWGMATACYPVHRLPCRAVIRIDPDGKLTVLCGTQDMGTGAYTVLAQLAANGVGVPVSTVVVELGDTTLPEAPYSGGSMSTASFTPAVESAAGSLRAELIALAVADADSPLYQADPAGVTIEAGQVREIGGNRAERLADLVGRRGQTLEAGGHADLDAEQQVSSNGYGAVFVEVRVDADLGEIRVSRVTAAYAAGRILNRKLAHSQYLGGLVMGIGMALHEETLMDHTLHRVVGDNLADYVIPVCADMPEFDIHLVDEADPHLPGGVKGIGMLGTVGTAGAIANAIYHATGVRLRRLPLRLNA